jgi:hypothetical protein
MLRRMKKTAPLFASLLAVLTPILVAAPAQATPKSGSRELRIGQEYLPPVALTNGLIRLEPDKGEGLTGLGLGAGMGWFVSDGIELGLSLSLNLIKGEGSTVTAPGAAPFMRFMFIQGRVGYFAELDISLQRFSSDNTSQTVVSLGGDLGLEFFVTEDWAVRVAPTFRHLIVSSSASNIGGTSSDEAGNRFGVTWGLACYF